MLRLMKKSKLLPITLLSIWAVNNIGCGSFQGAPEPPKGQEYIHWQGDAKFFCAEFESGTVCPQKSLDDFKVIYAYDADTKKNIQNYIDEMIRRLEDEESILAKDMGKESRFLFLKSLKDFRDSMQFLQGALDAQRSH